MKRVSSHGERHPCPTLSRRTATVQREQNRSSSRPQPTAKTVGRRIGSSGSTWTYPRAGWVPQKRQGMMGNRHLPHGAAVHRREHGKHPGSGYGERAVVEGKRSTNHQGSRREQHLNGKRPACWGPAPSKDTNPSERDVAERGEYSVASRPPRAPGKAWYRGKPRSVEASSVLIN
jgi:hypothetical protein